LIVLDRPFQIIQLVARDSVKLLLLLQLCFQGFELLTELRNLVLLLPVFFLEIFKLALLLSSVLLLLLLHFLIGGVALFHGLELLFANLLLLLSF